MRKVLCFFVLNTVPRQPSLPAGQCERVPLPSKSHPGQHVVHKQEGAKHIQAEEWDQQNRRDCGSRKNQMPDDNRSTCKRPVHGAVEYSTAHVRCWPALPVKPAAQEWHHKYHYKWHHTWHFMW